MRGSHSIKLRHVLSLPTSRRETCLLGRYHPNTSIKPAKSRSEKEFPRRRGTAKCIPITGGKDEKALQGSKTVDWDTTEQREPTLSSDKKVYSLQTGGNSKSFGRRTIWDPLPRWPAHHDRINAAFDHGGIASSALSSLESGVSLPSVETLLERDIGKHVFNLPVPRLRVWLYNLDVNRLLQLTLNHVYSDRCYAEKVLVAESVISKKLEFGGSVASCKQAYMLLKLQRTLLCRGIKSALNLPLYRFCIQFLNLKIGSITGDHMVDLCLILDDLWQYLLMKEGNLDLIANCHLIDKDQVDMMRLHTPLLQFLEKSLFDISAHTIPSLVKLLTRVQRYVAKESLMNLHELCFLKVIEHAGALPLELLLRTLAHLEVVQSLLPSPLYFVCQQILDRPGDTVDYANYHLVTRCLSRSTSVDLLSLKRVLLLYMSFTRSSGAEVHTSVEPFVMAVILRAFEIIPVTGEKAELNNTVLSISGNRGGDALPTRTCTNVVPLPRGYHKMVVCMEDIRWLLLQSLKSLGRSDDMLVRRLCDIAHLRRHYLIRGSTRLSLPTLLEASRRIECTVSEHKG